MRVLLVEDDTMIGESLREALRRQGMACDWVRDGRAADAVLVSERFDAVLLDLGLPQRDGLAVLRDLRARGDTTPVIVLTARDALPDKVKGLDSGADDYLVKPFAFSELLARIQVLLRRARPARATDGATVLGLADLEIDLIRRKAVRAGRRLELTAQEFGLLALFVRRQGEVLSRTEIAEQVWDMNFDSATNVIDVAIRRLRNKLDAPFERTLLHTVRGMGYVLESRDE